MHKQTPAAIDKTVYLIGASCVGKSYTGLKLAKSMELTFIDLDKRIQDKTGVDIQTIFDIEGEQGFRQYENKYLADIDTHPCIVALGAGAALQPDNQDIIQQGYIVYLQASLDYLQQRVRLSNKQHRPMLSQPNDTEQAQCVANMYTQRTPIYERLAHVTVNVGQRSVWQIVNDIQQRLSCYLNHQSHAC